MAPTEILSQQHYKSFCSLLRAEEINLALFTSGGCKLNGQDATKKEVLNKIKKGQVSLVVGTHALIQKNVEFKKLVLAIIDEQHRFGVQQRAELQKNLLRTEDGIETKVPHFLSMTATPIPRTLALTLFGDLDISILDEMPKGRQEILTKIVSPEQRNDAYRFTGEQIHQGRQAFVVCPRIELSENSQTQITAEIKAVTEEYKILSEKIFPDFKISMLHGKIKAKEKEGIMADFCAGKTDILISTSVIEVGIDVPNATVMLIEGADRFGLAQLHQFRGRIGRGAHKSFCLLFSDSNSRSALSRLKAMTQTKNGFELAQRDLELRGPGVFFGTKQSGLPDLTMASLVDMPLIKNCRQEAAGLLKRDPRLEEYPEIRKKLDQFKFELHLE
jgi:ATP-dependent DNA helicase RecG